MKLRRFQLILLALTLTFQICFGQEKPKAVLVDEISDINCEISKVAIEILYKELSVNPASTGYLIIYGEKDNQLKNYNTEQMLKNFVSYFGFNIKRIVFVHAKSEKVIRIQFWTIPAGADKPSYVEENWDYTLPKVTKSFIFYQEYYNSIGACDTGKFNFDELYSKILLSNPNLRGHLVIRENSGKAFRETKNNLLNRLTKSYKIPRKKLIFFYTKAKEFSDVEYWLVPESKK